MTDPAVWDLLFKTANGVGGALVVFLLGALFFINKERVRNGDKLLEITEKSIVASNRTASALEQLTTSIAANTRRRRTPPRRRPRSRR